MDSSESKKYDTTTIDVPEKENTLNPSSDENLSQDFALSEEIVIRKVDLAVLPILCGFYLLQAIDKGNIGLAKLGGIQTDTQTQGSLFNWAVSIFYLGYVLSELPSNLILQRIQPRVWIAFIGIVWGIIVTLTAFAKSFAGLALCRFFLGVFEAGILPASVLVTAIWYKRSEHAIRTAIWFCFSSLGTAIGGLISYGIQKSLVSSSGLHGWQWLMIIEGLGTIVWGILALLIFPDVPEHAKFLTEKERAFVINRLRLDKSHTALKFNREQFLEALSDYKTWFLFIIYFIWQCVNIAFSTFNPSIIAGLGYSDLNAQLLSAPFAIFNLILQLILSRSSDKLHDRGIHLIICGLLSVVGYLCVIVVKNNGALYGLLFFTSFNSGSLTLILGWMTNIIIGHTKRTVASSVIIIGSSLGGFVGGQIYQDYDAPKYIRGHTVNMVLMAVGIIMTLILRILLKFENKKRDRLIQENPSLVEHVHVIKDLNDIPEENFTDRDPSIRYIL